MSMKSAPVPSAQKAAFREEARRIIRADRAARLSGASQNTIGAMATAMERAFKLGRDGAASTGSSELTWEEIPPRGRDALRDLGTRTPRAHEGSQHQVTITTIEVEGRLRWRIEGESWNTHSYPPVAINPLVKLGLLEPHPDRPDALVLSSAGITAFESYWARYIAEDRTLPLAGMRPTKQGY